MNAWVKVVEIIVISMHFVPIPQAPSPVIVCQDIKEMVSSASLYKMLYEVVETEVHDLQTIEIRWFEEKHERW